MDKIVGEARTEARLTVAALEKTEAPRNNEIESATRVCLVRTPMEERQVSFDTYLSDDCLVFSPSLSSRCWKFRESRSIFFDSFVSKCRFDWLRN